MDKIKKPSKKALIFCCTAVLAIIATIVALVFVNATNVNDPESQQPHESEQIEMDTAEDNSHSELDATTDSLRSAEQTIQYQTSQQPTTKNSTQPATDESNLPLCQRKYLSDEEVQLCAEQLRQKMDAEDQRVIAENRTKWCAENMPQMYAQYNSMLLYENQRYEEEVSNNVRAHLNSGASGDETVLREVAEKTYSPLHIQMVNDIVNRYIQDAQSHGCDVSSYSL